MSRQVSLRLGHLRSSLANLPPLLASQLSAQGILPQSLAIELSSSPKQTLFVGWSGLSSNDTNPRFSSHQRPSSTRNAPELIESIELDQSLAAQMGWKDSDRLAIKLYHRDLNHATSLNVEPLTVDDWEILESNPQYLEDNILKQIRVVVQSQHLLIWVYDKTLVQVKVTSILPAPSNPRADRVPYLITNQTEVVVCPKSRLDSSIQDAGRRKHILGGSKGTDTPSRQKQAPPTERKTIDLRILPRAFPLGTHQSPLPSGGDDQPFALVNTLQFSQLETEFPTTLCSLELLLRPNQALPNPKPPSTEMPSRQGPSKNSKTNTNVIPSPADRVRILSHPNVPFGFICLSKPFLLRCFSSLLPAWDPKSSPSLVGRPGDYEYVRIGPSKVTSSDLNSTDSSENVPFVDQDRIESRTEEWATSHLDSRSITSSSFYMQTALATGNLFFHGEHRSGNHHLSGLMICGSSGSGKTSLVKTLIEKIYLDPQLMMYSRYIDCGKHVDDRLGVLKSRITEWFDDAAWHSPSVLVLDDLDQLLPAEAEHLDSFRYRHFTEEFLSIARTATKDRLVTLVATCSSSSAIHNLLRSGTHMFSETLELKGLSRNNRKEILAELLKLKVKKSGLDISLVKPDLLCSEKTEGYLPSDLKDLVDRAVHQAIIRSLKITHRIESKPVSLEMVDFDTAQSGFVPISLRDIKLQKSGVNWEDIGGLTETRRILRETLEWPTKYPSVFADCPLRLRSGLLLYGYPGCGKTLLASAIAKECGLNFINIKGPELLNKYIGASEQSVRDLFQRAQAAKPCVLFFDEFESIAPKRGHDSTGVTDRVVNQLLTQMDGAEGLEGVYVLAATSRPDLIDPALLRPGRLDKSLLCSMPTAEERHDILKAVSRKLPLDDDLSFEELSRMTDGFTGADLQALIYSAHLEVVHESIQAKASETILELNGSREKEHDSKFTWTEVVPVLHHHSPASKINGIVKSHAENQSMRKRIEQVLDNTSTLDDKSSLRKPNKINKSFAQLPSPNLIEMRHIRSALRNARPSVPETELRRLTKISDGGLPDGQASEEIGGRASLM